MFVVALTFILLLFNLFAHSMGLNSIWFIKIINSQKTVIAFQTRNTLEDTLTAKRVVHGYKK